MKFISLLYYAALQLLENLTAAAVSTSSVVLKLIITGIQFVQLSLQREGRISYGPSWPYILFQTQTKSTSHH